ncbi:MAG: T9SS type A sorting domain-containing protein [Bacteroidota bacterium]
MKSISTFLLSILFIIISIIQTRAQIQLGDDFNGEASEQLLGHDMALSRDGSRLAIASPGFDDELGKVQVYQWEEDQWVQLGSNIIPPQNGYFFGESITLSGDGNRLVIAALSDLSYLDMQLVKFVELGQVVEYEWNEEEWVLTNPVFEMIDYSFDIHDFIDISLSEDGKNLIVTTKWTEPFEQRGTVTVYQRSVDSWVQKGDALYGGGEFNDWGASTELSADGNRLLIGDPLETIGTVDDLGAIRTFEWRDSSWNFMNFAIRGAFPESGIGTHAALSPDGEYLLYSDRILELFNNMFLVKPMKWDGESWITYGNEFIPFSKSQSLIGNHLRVDISENGNVIAIADPQFNTADPQLGRIAIYQKSGDNWIQAGEVLTGSTDGDRLGTQLVLSNDGKTLAVGSSSVGENGENSGQVKVYSLQPITSTENTVIPKFQLHPNPTTGIVTWNTADINKINILNNLGQTVRIVNNPGQNLDISELRNGIYYLQIHHSKEVQTTKLIKQ